MRNLEKMRSANNPTITTSHSTCTENGSRKGTLLRNIHFLGYYVKIVLVEAEALRLHLATGDQPNGDLIEKATSLIENLEQVATFAREIGNQTAHE